MITYVLFTNATITYIYRLTLSIVIFLLINHTADFETDDNCIDERSYLFREYYLNLYIYIKEFAILSLFE